MTAPEGPDPLALAHPTRVAVVGAGAVGTTFAFALLLSGLAAEIVLVDANERKAEGEAMDLMHAVPFARTARVWAGPITDCKGAAVTVIAAGAAQKPGETRLDLVAEERGDLPLDRPPGRRGEPGRDHPRRDEPGRRPELPHLPDQRPAVGAGHRQRHDPRHRRASGCCSPSTTASTRAPSTPTWRASTATPRCPSGRSANIAGMPLERLRGHHGHRATTPTRSREIYTDTRDAAYQIIERKGATYYAVAAGLVRIVEAILRDQHTVLSVSSLIHDYYGIDDVYLASPRSSAGDGVERIVPLGLSAEEASGLRRSAELLRETIGHLGLDEPA